MGHVDSQPTCSAVVLLVIDRLRMGDDAHP
jgi:hypothetical protein